MCGGRSSAKPAPPQSWAFDPDSRGRRRESGAEQEPERGRPLLVSFEEEVTGPPPLNLVDRRGFDYGGPEAAMAVADEAIRNTENNPSRVFHGVNHRALAQKGMKQLAGCPSNA